MVGLAYDAKYDRLDREAIAEAKLQKVAGAWHAYIGTLAVQFTSSVFVSFFARPPTPK